MLDPAGTLVRGDAELNGITAWAVSGAHPSARPWEHAVPGGDLRAVLFPPADDAREIVAGLLDRVSADDLRAMLGVAPR